MRGENLHASGKWETMKLSWFAQFLKYVQVEMNPEKQQKIKSRFFSQTIQPAR